MDIWQQCRLRYKYYYVDKYIGCQTPNEDSLTFGSFIHEVFEVGVLANTTSTADLIRIAEGLKSKYKIPHEKDAATKTCIRNFVTFNSGMEAKDVSTLGCEIEYKIDLGDGIFATGVIDRVLRSETGSLLVIDYKTSKREKSKVQLYMDPQLKGYALAACELYGIPVREAGSKIICAHYYPVTNNFVHVSFPGTELAKHSKKVKEQAWRIRKSTLESLTPAKNEYCNFCQYKSICPLYEDSETIQCNLLLEKQKLEAKQLAESKGQSQ